MKAIGYITATLFVIASTTLWSGYVLTILWGWFIVPVFSAPSLGVAQAIGVTLVLHHLQLKPYRKHGEFPYEKVLSDGFANGMSFPALALLMGWVVRLF